MIKIKANVNKFDNNNIVTELSVPTVNSINKNNTIQINAIGINEIKTKNKCQKLFFVILKVRLKELSCCAAVAGNINETLTT